MMGKDFYRYNK